MGNCLKTQLKQEVQNNNLLKIGEFILTGNSNDWSLRITSQESVIVRTINGENALLSPTLSISTPTNSITIPANTFRCQIRPVTGSGKYLKVVIDNKYGLSRIDDNNLDMLLGDLKYTELDTLLARYSHLGEFTDINTTELTTLDLYSSYLTGTINDISAPLLQSYYLPITDNSIALSDLVSNKLPALTYINNWSACNFTKDANGPSLEKFAEKLLQMYPTRTVTIERGNRITFNGAYLPNPSSTLYYVVANTNTVSVKAGDTVIGTYDGTSWTYNS